MHTYHNLLYSLEQEEKLCKLAHSNVEAKTKGVYHLKMKEKLLRRVKVEPKTPPSKFSSHMSHSMFTEKNPENTNPRHKRSFAEYGNMTDTKMNRKYSVGTEFLSDEACATISENHRKYI